MKITPQDKEMFNALAKSQIGTNLINYLERLEDFICDSRTWSEGDTKESALMASKAIKEHIRGKIKPEKAKGVMSNDFE